MAEPLPTPPPGKLNREQYRSWADAQPRGRFELVAGEVVAMSPERIGHAEAKAAAYTALSRAVAAAGVKCRVLPDGITVEVDENTDYIPDAIVNCGERPDRNAVAAPNPVIVVEVASPSTRSVDTNAKLGGYFRVPSIQHYLIVETGRRLVIHHRRDGKGGIATRVVASGGIEMDPPGIAIILEDLFED